ncbi:MAG: hypothetical protein WC548_01885 [Candidatus Pacearchaeota archaeon]
MKKKIVILLAVFLICYVVAMDDPITVKTTPGNQVKVYAWTAGSGPLIVMKEGIADSNGLFNVTFFSLMESSAKFQVIITDSGKNKIRESKFDNKETDVPYLIDCVPIDCIISVYTEEAILNVTTNSTINSSNKSESLNDTEKKQNVFNDIFNGKSIFTTEEGKINYMVIAICMIILILILLGIYFIFFKNMKIKKDPEEKELEKIEHQVKEKEEELKKIKEINLRRLKIEEAKKKLASEEKQIQIYRELNPEERMRRKRLEEAQRKLEEDERKIKELKEGNLAEVQKEDLYNRLDKMDQLKNNQDRNDIRNSPAVKGFVDNMRRTGTTEGDKKNPL